MMLKKVGNDICLMSNGGLPGQKYHSRPELSISGQASPPSDYVTVQFNEPI